MTFDLEKARAVCKTLPKYMNGACPCKEEAEAAKMLIKALPEIRRLQEFRDRVARILKQPLTDCDDLLILGLDARICQLRRQAAEIERLRAEISEQKGMIWKTQQVKKEQAAQIKELEDALIEQEARFQYYVQNENCESWPEARRRYPELNEKYLKIARQHLRAEGKIGPDADAKPREGLYGKYCISKADGSPVDPNADYFVLRLDTDPVARRAAREYSYVTPDRDLARGLQDRLAKYDPQLKDCMNIRFFGLEKPQVWQITEERKAVILHCKRMLTFLKEDDAPCYDVEKITKDESVLVAMLEDAK
jgi:hypothetical protein